MRWTFELLALIVGIVIGAGIREYYMVFGSLDCPFCKREIVKHGRCVNCSPYTKRHSDFHD